MTATRPAAPLDTVSIRLRVTTAVIIVLALVLVGLSVTVQAVFVVSSNRNIDALLTGRAQLARQLARSGVGPQQIVNRVEADGVRASLVLVGGQQFGTQAQATAQTKITTIVLNAPTRVDGAQLTLGIDTSLVRGPRITLRRILVIGGLVAVLLSAALVALAIRLALRPLTAMAEVAKSITGGRRGSRLQPTRTDTEIGQTAQAFDEMLDELEGAESRARQAEERTRAFLADAAHELRTPITGVQAAAETLLHHGDTLDHDQRQQLEALLVREAQRAGALVSDLLAAARLDAGVDLDRRPASLGSIAATELDRVRLLYPQATLTTSGEDLIADVDASKISSVLRNVIENAVRASGAHGQVHLGLRRDGNAAVVEIWDSGPGVRAEDRERIFDRLVRLDHGRAADSGGSGLGLAIARGYARAHGGDLTCEDPNGSGALFRLSLPMHPPPPHPPSLLQATGGS